MIINCTPHEIKVQHGARTISFQPSGIIPRVDSEDQDADPIHGIPTVITKSGKPTGLPDPSAQCIDCKCPVAFDSGPDCECGGQIENVYLIVSRMVFDASDRKDLICPDTGATCIRDYKGHIQAVTRFIRRD